MAFCVLIVMICSCKKEGLTEDANKQSIEQIMTKADAQNALLKIKQHPDQYVFHQFEKEYKGRNGVCQIAVVGLAIGPFTPIPGNPNKFICESMTGFYQFYVQGRCITVPVRLTAKQTSGNRPRLLYSGLSRATSLPSPDDLGIVSADRSFVIPINETVLYTIKPIFCGEGFDFSYVFTGKNSGIGNISVEDFLSSFSQ